MNDINYQYNISKLLVTGNCIEYSNNCVFNSMHMDGNDEY